MRLFFALWPDAETRSRIAAAAALLRLGAEARTVPPQNYHVTLAFLGEVGPSQVEVLREIGRCQQLLGFTVGFDTVDFWPQSQVVVAAAAKIPAALNELWTSLRGDLASQPVNFWRERVDPQRSSLRAHVTLARKVVQAPVRQAMSAMPPFQWSATSFSLVRSESSGNGSIYTVVDTWRLLDENANT
jgi:2'-5' RNA ligase